MAENPANHVFVDWDVERQGDLLGDSRTAPIGITLLHSDDHMNEIYARSFRTGLPTAIRGEEHPVVHTENSVRITQHTCGTLIADLVDALSLLASTSQSEDWNSLPRPIVECIKVARPKHLGFPLDLPPIESEIVDAVFQSEKSIRGEPVESCKLRYFNSFELTIRVEKHCQFPSTQLAQFALLLAQNLVTETCELSSGRTPECRR